MLEASGGLIHHEKGIFLAYSYQNVNLVVWEDALDLSAVRLVDQVHTRWQRAIGTRLSLVSVLTPRVGFPSAQVRAEIHALQVRWRPTIGCFVAVLETDGMWRSAVRGFLGAIQALAPDGEGRIQLTTNLGTAASWLVEPHERVTGVKLDVRALKEFFERSRHGVPSHPTRTFDGERTGG